MGRLPAFQFYPGDWSRDLGEHPLEIEGAWIRICCTLFWSETCGTATKTLGTWGRILRVEKRTCKRLINFLLNQKIADVFIQNETITITCRRMVKDAYIRKIRKECGSMGGNPKLKHTDIGSVLVKQIGHVGDNQKLTPSSSSSSSDLKPTPSVRFDEFWKVYPRRVAKASALKEWKKINPENGLVETILKAVEVHKNSEQWKKDNGQFIPHPATWLHQRRWEDDLRVAEKDWRDF